MIEKENQTSPADPLTVEALEERIILDGSLSDDGFEEEIAVRIPTDGGELQYLLTGEVRTVYASEALSGDGAAQPLTAAPAPASAPASAAAPQTVVDQSGSIISLTSDRKDKIGRLQVGSLSGEPDCNSRLYVSIRLPAAMKNAQISKAVLRLYQSYSQLAESGGAMELYQTASFSAGDMKFSESNRLATVYTTNNTGVYRSMDITGAVREAPGQTVYLVLKMKESCCACGSCCTASNAVFFTEGKLAVTCAGTPIESGVYTARNYGNGRYLTVGPDWPEAGDTAVQHTGKTGSPAAELGQMWRINSLTNGLYSLQSILNPCIGLTVQKVSGINRVTAKAMGQCGTDASEDMQWLVIPFGSNWILYHAYTKLTVRTNSADLNDGIPLEAASYSEESCTACQQWSLGKVSSPPADILLYSDSTGWMGSDAGLSVYAGSSLRLRCAFHEQYNCACAASWSSSNPAAAAVSASGWITAKEAGSAVITVTVNGRKKSCPLTVRAVGLSVSRTSALLTVGGTVQLTANTTPSDRTVSWKSSDPDVAAVSGGLVTAKAIGTAVITASAIGAVSKTCTVTVAAPTLSIRYNGDCKPVGGNLQLWFDTNLPSGVIHGAPPTLLWRLFRSQAI